MNSSVEPGGLGLAFVENDLGSGLAFVANGVARAGLC
jgi:hypothetical protein